MSLPRPWLDNHKGYMHFFKPEIDVTWYNEILRYAWSFFVVVFFSAVKGKTPQVGDRVLVEAVYNPNMPFKWNAQRIQTLPQLANQSVRTASGCTQCLMKEKKILLFNNNIKWGFAWIFCSFCVLFLESLLKHNYSTTWLKLQNCVNTYSICAWYVENCRIIVLFTFIRVSLIPTPFKLGFQKRSRSSPPKDGKLCLGSCSHICACLFIKWTKHWNTCQSYVVKLTTYILGFLENPKVISTDSC